MTQEAVYIGQGRPVVAALFLRKSLQDFRRILKEIPSWKVMDLSPRLVYVILFQRVIVEEQIRPVYSKMKQLRIFVNDLPGFGIYFLSYLLPVYVMCVRRRHFDSSFLLSVSNESLKSHLGENIDDTDHGTDHGTQINYR